MNKLTRVINTLPELQDQLDLFKHTAHHESFLVQDNRKLVAWAAAMASQHQPLTAFVEAELGQLNSDQKKLVTIASSRMSVTNPYFMSRNVHPLQAGGSLADLHMRPFSELGIDNAIGYHYACIAISLINGGFVCFNSHINSLKHSGESEQAIDQALRLVSAMSCIKQMMFNQAALGN